VVLGGLLAIGRSGAGCRLSFYPTVAVSGVYNDNIRLTNVPGNEISVSGAELDAALRMRAETPRSFFSLRAAAIYVLSESRGGFRPVREPVVRDSPRNARGRRWMRTGPT
jgi:hypothetical protein